MRRPRRSHGPRRCRARARRYHGGDRARLPLRPRRRARSGPGVARHPPAARAVGHHHRSLRVIRWLPLVDSALTLVFGDEIDSHTHARILAVARILREEPPRGVTEVVPAYTTLSVWFNPLERDAADLASELVEIAEE